MQSEGSKIISLSVCCFISKKTRTPRTYQKIKFYHFYLMKIKLVTMHKRIPHNGKSPFIIEFKNMETHEESPNKKQCLRRSNESHPALERMAEALMALKSESFEIQEPSGKSPLRKPELTKNIMPDKAKSSITVPSTRIVQKHTQSDIFRLKRCLSKIVSHPRTSVKLNLKNQAFAPNGQPLPPPPRLLKRAWGETL